MNQPASPLSARVLVVDDDSVNREMLRRVFEKRTSCEVLLAKDGEQALSTALSAHPDLILLDMLMPGLSGIDVLRALRGQGALMPVIMLTAVGRPEQIVEAMQAGASDYITKPFSIPVLLERVERVLLAASHVVDADAIVDVEAVAVPGHADGVLVGSAVVGSAVVDVDDGVVIELPARPPPAPFGDDETVASAPDVPRPMQLVPRSSTPANFMALFQSIKQRVLEGQPTLAQGSVLDDRYRLTRPVGTGAFGAVWEARHIDLDVDVAIKVLHRDAKEVRPGESPLVSFRREAMLLARVTSPSCVRVTDFGVTADGHAFMVMEHLAGESLRTYLERKGQLDLADACDIVARICDALASAHRHGVVHRDVKARNVVVVPGDGDTRQIKLIDFGAACVVDDDGGGGALVGTPTHMAPEAFLSTRGATAADIYAAGVVLVQLLTGALPFVGDNVDVIARHHRKTPPPRVSMVNAALAPVDELVYAMLDKEPSGRPSAVEAARRLRTIAALS